MIHKIFSSMTAIFYFIRKPEPVDMFGAPVYSFFPVSDLEKCYILL